MENEVLQRCRAVIVSLLRHPNIMSTLENPPCQLMFDIVKNKMTLSIMHEKLLQKEYSSISEFQKDFYLMCSNILMYNGTSDASAFALQIRDAFTLLLPSITETHFPEQFRIFQEHITSMRIQRSLPCGMTWDEISDLGARLNAIKDPVILRRIHQWLISMVPHLDNSLQNIDLCTLPQSILQGLKQELDSC